jgi:hypothetical protein
MNCQIVELRRYALRPGARETLIELFDREFVETQEELGMCVLGQFRDLDDPDSFVWLRGFSDMATRRQALEAFYTGPIWKRHGAAANATMLDSDNVLLLRERSAPPHRPETRPSHGQNDDQPGLVLVSVYPLTSSAASDFPEYFEREVEPTLRESGIAVLGTYATEHAENTFPALPVREGIEVFVWTTIAADESEHEQLVSGLDGIAEALTQRLDGPAEVLRLQPTPRSAIHG